MAVRRELYAGVMSGTSLDGVDAVIAEFAVSSGNAFATLGATHITFPSALRDELLALQSAGNDEIARAARAANALADLYARAIADACDACGVAPHDLVAAGVHGQTIRHRPEQGWTLQSTIPRASRSVPTSRSWRTSGAATSRQAARARRWCRRFTRPCSGIRKPIASLSTSAASPISPICRRAERSAGSTRAGQRADGPAGPRAIAGCLSTSGGRGRRRAGWIRRC